MIDCDTWWSPWHEATDSLILHVDLRLDPGREARALALLEGEPSALFRFPHLPSAPFWLEDLGASRFAAARAYRLKA